MRRYGRSPVNGQVYRPRPGAYAVLPRNGQVLVTWQDAPHFEFQLPGGGIDPGESPVRALHREVYEETGWHIANPRRLGAFRRFAYMPEYDRWAEKICHIYIARPTLCMGPPVEPDHTAVWMDAAQAAVLLAGDEDADFLAKALL